MKISIIGVGNVGSAIAFALLNKKWKGKIILVDTNEKKLYGEWLDITHAGKVLNENIEIIMNTGNSEIAKSDWIIICAGKARKSSQSMSYLKLHNTPVVEDIIVNAKYYSPNSGIVMVTNPADEMRKIADKVFDTVAIPDYLLDAARLKHCKDKNKLSFMASEIVKNKGYTNWGVAAVANLIC